MARADRLLLGHNPQIVEFIRRLGLDPSLTRRVIVDMNVDDVVRVYVEGFADRAAFEIDVSGVLENGYRIHLASEDGRSIDVTAHETAEVG